MLISVFHIKMNKNTDLETAALIILICALITKLSSFIYTIMTYYKYKKYFKELKYVIFIFGSMMIYYVFVILRTLTEEDILMRKWVVPLTEGISNCVEICNYIFWLMF